MFEINKFDKEFESARNTGLEELVRASRNYEMMLNARLVRILTKKEGSK